MGYQPRGKSPRRTIHQYKRTMHEKVKGKKGSRRQLGRPVEEEKPVATEREIAELTLKRLHTLGNQRFGSSPFSEHFDRWLMNVREVIGEFESNPNIGIDDQFLEEITQTLSAIKQQLESRRRRETVVEQEIAQLSDCKNHLKLINSEHAVKTREAKSRRDSQTRRLEAEITRLKTEQNRIIKLKTGFFRRLSKKKREQMEADVTKELTDRQNDLELAMMDFKAAQDELQYEFAKKKEPVLEQIKVFKKTIGNPEVDGSLEDRWLACEALIDSVNAFLERKSSQHHQPI